MQIKKVDALCGMVLNGMEQFGQRDVLSMVTLDYRGVSGLELGVYSLLSPAWN